MAPEMHHNSAVTEFAMPHPSPMTQRTVRLLIADDHVMFRKSLRTLLELDPSFEVVGEAGNGRRLLALVDTTPADVILLDIGMPGLDGFEVLESLDAQRRAAVIVLTANATRDEIARVGRLGAGGLLLKDVELEALHGAVRRVASGDQALPCPGSDTGDRSGGEAPQP